MIDVRDSVIIGIIAVGVALFVMITRIKVGEDTT